MSLVGRDRHEVLVMLQQQNAKLRIGTSTAIPLKLLAAAERVGVPVHDTKAA